MMNHCLLFVLFVVLLSYGRPAENASIAPDKLQTHLFRDSATNELFKNYRLLYEPYGKHIYTLTFDTDSTVVISSALFIDRELLAGHAYLDKELVLIYGSPEIAAIYLDTSIIGQDSIRDFPYEEQIDNLPPFDPPVKKYDLIRKKEIRGFRGLNPPSMTNYEDTDL